jgi:hypothetical protein
MPSVQIRRERPGDQQRMPPFKDTDLLAAAQAAPAECPAGELQDTAAPAKPDALANVRGAIRDIQRSGATTWG